MKFDLKKLDWQLALFGLLGIGILINVILVSGVDFDSAEASTDYRLTLITAPDCEDCFDLTPLKDYVIENGVEDSAITEIAYDTRAGKKLIKKYGIKDVPAAIINGDVRSATYISDLDGKIGDIVDDSTFVLNKLQPPYLELETGKKRGVFEVVFVSDSSCAECYNVNEHQGVLERLAMKPSKESTVDLNSEEGKLLQEQYFLTAVPTILFRGDLEPYDQLTELWDRVGTKEDDGTYVLRQGVSEMGVYKQYPEGILITPPAEPTDINQ